MAALLSVPTVASGVVAGGDDADNPLVPMTWEVLVGGIGLTLLLYMVVALIAVASSHAVSRPVKLVWAVVVLAFPVVGPTAWFVWRAQATREETTSSSVPSRDGR